jgi:hypothetical protein
MGQHARSIEIDQNELAAAANADDATALYLAIECSLTLGRDKLWQKNLGRNNSAAHDHVAKRAHDVFDFGELRHGCEFDLREGLQSSPPSGMVFSFDFAILAALLLCTKLNG